MKVTDNHSMVQIELSFEEAEIFCAVLQATEGILENEQHEELTEKLQLELEDYIELNK